MSEESYRLSEYGEKEAVESIGGQDVANVASALVEILRQHGTFLGGKLEGDGVWEWGVAVTWARVVRHLVDQENWITIVRGLESEVLDGTSFFDRMPSALPDLASGLEAS